MALGRLAIRTHISMENTSYIGALEESNKNLFAVGADNNAKDIFSSGGVGGMLQAMSANGNDSSILQQHRELPHAIITSPNVQEVRNNARTHHLAVAERGIGRAFGFIHILANQMTTD